jgi:diguanylate cyclase (GGDEF)-like protein
VALAITSTLMSVKTYRFLRRPRDGAERAVGLAVTALAISAWLRAAFTCTAAGEPPPHLLHIPDWLMSPFAVLYGMFPILVATLLLGVVNARLRKHLNTRAMTDELTGVLTRRALRELAPNAIERQRQSDQVMTTLMLDLDHFKIINDHFGHASGDLVLQRTGEVLRAQLRADALLARFGGEEFVALVPVSNLRAARQMAERLREAVATTPWRAVDGRAMTVTLSVGVSLIGEHETLDAALQRADEALYRAKQEGRNQVQVAIVAA